MIGVFTDAQKLLLDNELKVCSNSLKDSSRVNDYKNVRLAKQRPGWNFENSLVAPHNRTIIHPYVSLFGLIGQHNMTHFIGYSVKYDSNLNSYDCDNTYYRTPCKDENQNRESKHWFVACQMSNGCKLTKWQVIKMRYIKIVLITRKKSLYWKYGESYWWFVSSFGARKTILQVLANA